MKVYKAVHERENKCKELHKEMNMNVGPTRLLPVGRCGRSAETGEYLGK